MIDPKVGQDESHLMTDMIEGTTLIDVVTIMTETCLQILTTDQGLTIMTDHDSIPLIDVTTGSRTGHEGHPLMIDQHGDKMYPTMDVNIGIVMTITTMTIVTIETIDVPHHQVELMIEDKQINTVETHHDHLHVIILVHTMIIHGIIDQPILAIETVDHQIVHSDHPTDAPQHHTMPSVWVIVLYHVPGVETVDWMEMLTATVIVPDPVLGVEIADWAE